MADTNSTDTTGGLNNTATATPVSSDPKASTPGPAEPAQQSGTTLPPGSVSDKPPTSSKYLMWRGNNTPPVGWITQSKVVLTRLGDKTPHMDITALQIDQDVTTSTGTGTLTIAWDEEVYDNLQTADEIRIWWGYTKKDIVLPFQKIQAPKITDDMGAYVNLRSLTVLPAIGKGKVNDDCSWAMHNVECIPLVFTGYIKDVKPTAATIVIDLYDKGVLLEKACTSTFANEKRSKIAQELCHQAGLLCYIDWEGKTNFDEVVASFPGATNTSSSGTAGTGSTGTSGTTTGTQPAGAGTGTGTGTPGSSTSVGAPVAGTGNTPQAGAATSQTICSANSPKDTGCSQFASVPYAADGPHCFFNQCQSPTCMRTGTLVYPSPMAGCSDQIHCSACKADYDGKTGEELSSKCAYGLVPASGTSASAGNSTNGTSQQTYWDTLIALMQVTTVDVEIYIHLDTVYIIQIPPQSEFNLIIDDEWNVKKDSVTITDPQTNQPNAVIVTYGKGAKPEKVAAGKIPNIPGNAVSVFDPVMYDKYGYNPITVTAPQYNDAESALSYGLKQLAVAERNNGLEVDVTIVGSPYIYPHWWCRTILSRYGKTIDKVLYMTKTSLKLVAGKATLTDVVLEDYYPDVSITLKSNDSSGVLNMSTLQGIVQSAAGWSWCSQSSEQQLISSGCGDCYAMSDYLYDKLNAAGITTRILQYYSPYSSSGTHRTVQIETNGQWEDMPDYSMLATDFHPLAVKTNCFIYKQAPAGSPTTTPTQTSGPTG